MSLARLGFFAVIATIVAHAPQVANNLDVANRVEASYAKREVSPAIPLPVQSKNPELLGVGKILVASRSLGDPYFAQTVILLVQFDAGGVVGLILNRRTELPVSRVLGDYQAAKDRSDPVYFGGPVDSQQIRALRKSPANLDGATQICHGVYLIGPARTDPNRSGCPQSFSCVSGVCRMAGRSTAKGNGTGGVVRFSRRCRDRLQFRSRFLVAADDS
jgi:hypothetical protein